MIVAAMSSGQFEIAGVGDDGWGCGVAVGDIDGDGDPDLFVTNFGPDVLYRNEGDGTEQKDILKTRDGERVTRLRLGRGDSLVAGTATGSLYRLDVAPAA